MPNQSLVDLMERTATADTDLVHVNSGGSDYKQTKANFLRGNLSLEFSFSSLLTAQVDALPVDATYFGYLWNYGHTTETGMPINGLSYINVKRSPNAQYSVIEAWSTYSPEADHYICGKSSGTWGSWTKVPTRSEITSLNNSLTNSFTMVELMRQLNVPTSDTSYSCDWANYRVLVIAHVFYGNVMSTIVESREHMMISNSGNRVIASTPSNDVQWSVWKNGDNAVWVRASSANAQNGIAIFGLGKIS